MEVLVGSSVMPAVESLIHDSARELIVISAFFQPGPRIELELKSAAKVRGVPTWLVTRPLRQDVARPFVEAGVHCLSLARVHAKLYVNERHAIVSSMNLDRHAGSGSWDISVVMDAHDDEAAYAQVLLGLGELWRRVDMEAVVQERPAPVRPTLLGGPAARRAGTAALKVGDRVTHSWQSGHRVRTSTGTVVEVYRRKAKVAWDDRPAPQGNPLITELVGC